MDNDITELCPVSESERIKFEIPNDLALAMAEVAEGGGSAEVRTAVRILREEISLLLNANEPGWQDVVRAVTWIDLFVMRCIVDEDGYLELWEENAEIIAELITATEQLFNASLSESGADLPGHKTHRSDMTPASLHQRLNAYLCISAGYAKDNSEFAARLYRVSSATEANVDHLLSHWNSEDLARMENVGRYGFYKPGTRYWTEPLALLSYAALSIRKAREVRHAYEGYIEHLEKAGADIEGVRARLLLDAELTLGNLLGDSVEEIYPEYPLDFSASDGIRKLIAGNPSLPIVVFVGPEGTCGTYCEIEGAEVVELLNRRTYHYNIADVATSREELISAIAQDIRDFGCVEGFDESWTDEQVIQAAKKEAARFEDDWVPAIAIHASWKDA